MSTLGERIKHAREAKGLLQNDLAKLIGVKSSAVISNWEKDLNKPDAEKIVKLCTVLEISVSFLLDYYGKSSFEFSALEEEHIKKYRLLDTHGKDMVDTVLEKEYNRCMNAGKLLSLPAANTKDTLYLEPDAAHMRTDIDVTPEDIQHDDDIMNNDDLWKK